MTQTGRSVHDTDMTFDSKLDNLPLFPYHKRQGQIKISLFGFRLAAGIKPVGLYGTLLEGFTAAMKTTSERKNSGRGYLWRQRALM